MLEQGQIFRLDLDEALGDSTRVMLPHPEIIEASEIGHVLLVDDGKVKLTVSGKGEGYLDCTVDVEGKISNRKVCILQQVCRYIGMNSQLNTSCMTTISCSFFAALIRE